MYLYARHLRWRMPFFALVASSKAGCHVWEIGPPCGLGEELIYELLLEPLPRLQPRTFCKVHVKWLHPAVARG